MNLSSYLQMPPAPLGPTSTSSTATQGGRPGAGPSTGANLGFDFAEVMARQMQRLVPVQRQTIAAGSPQNQEPQQEQQEPPQENSQQLRNQRSTEPSNQETRDTRTSDDATNEDANDSSSSHTRHRARVATPKTATADASLLQGLMQATPAAPIQAVVAPITNAAAPETAQATAVSTPTPLQTIELSPQVRIITDPKKAPSPESLAAFAKSMGLDESAIQNLLGQAPTSAATDLTSAAATNTTGLPSTGVSPAAPSGLPAAIGAALNGLPNTTPPTADSAVATQLAAMSATAVQTPVTASGAGVGAIANASTLTAASALPGLTPTDMAAIQQLQITVLPAAVLPINTAVTNASTPSHSTIDMLSLLGSGVNEQDVGALLSSFSEDAGSESSADQQPSQGDGNNFSSFGQALARSSNAANASTANATQATAPNMSEVYDQLSDKMTTELAARMHKQLSDGEWKMKFALRPSNLGGVEIQLEMKDGKLDAVFRADNPLTRDLLQNSSQRLREALGNLGINAGQVNVGQGGGNAQQQQNNAGNGGKPSQVRDNSSSQVNGSDSASSATSARSKANASLLDLYA